MAQLSIHRQAVIFVLALLCVFLPTASAFAFGSFGDYQCINGQVTGQLFKAGASCPTTLSIDNFFSFLVCNMEQLSSNLMGHMFCGLMSSLEPTVWAAVTLAVTFFGASFLIGLTPATGRDAILFIIKIAFITGFATSADLIIGTGYRLLVDGMREGVTIVLSGMGNGNSTPEDLYKQLDGFLAQFFHYATDSVSKAEGAGRCKNAVFAVIAVMAAAFPMISYLALLLIGRIVLTFYRAVFGYLYALVGITFLLTLAPFFLTFYLFKQTRDFFDKWIGYLVSFSLQIVLLFAFLSFVFALQPTSMLSNLGNIIMYQEQSVEGTSFRLPWSYCTLCDFKVVDSTQCSPLSSSCPAIKPDHKNADGQNDYLTVGALVCNDYRNDPEIDRFNPKPDDQGRIPITLTKAVSPDTLKPTGQLGTLMDFASYGIVSLIVLAILVERLLAMLPGLGQQLASGLARYAPQLGGGSSPYTTAMGMPGDNMIRDFNLGFNRGFNDVAYRNSNAITRFTGNPGESAPSVLQGVKDGMSTMLSGQRVSRDKDGNAIKDSEGKTQYETMRTRDAHGNTIETGMSNNFMRWLTDPNRFHD